MSELPPSPIHFPEVVRLSSTLLATYEEANIERTGKYSLFADHLEVVLNYQLRAEAEFSVGLDELTTGTIALRVRNSFFNLAVWTLGLSIGARGVISLLNIYVSLGMQSIFYGLLVFGAVSLLLGIRKQRFISVLGPNGAPRITIGEGRGGQLALEAFVNQLKNAVQARQRPQA